MSKYHKYYDMLNQKKDYAKDIEHIEKLSGQVHNALEVGCGTGNHTIQLCKIAKHVSACDLDPLMVEIALKKLEKYNVSIYTSISDIPYKNFQLCVMMWHVLNYFPSLQMMNEVFKQVYSRMKEGSLFVFDMWNGVAVLRDLPNTSTYEFSDGSTSIKHVLTGTTSLMEQRTDILNTITISRNGSIVDEFTHNVSHYIWTVKTVGEMLEAHGFNYSVVKTTNYNIKADDKDWKVAVIARK